MPVIKSNAYGHGLHEIARLCEASPLVDRICVVNLEEALDLINLGIKKRLLILGIYELDRKKILPAIKHNVIFPIFSLNQAKVLNAVGRLCNRQVTVHVKIDTGTSRIGIFPDETVSFIQKLQHYKYLNVEGLWSHFASSEDDPDLTKKQHSIFENVGKALIEKGFHIPIKHMACSASTVLYPWSECNAVRFGIGLYGLHPDITTKPHVKLEPALAWKTTVIQVKTVPKGTRISYGGTYTAKRLSKLAVLPIGYWDGYARNLSNKASVLIRGKRCPVRGIICMNVLMVDVTHVRGVKAGDGVTIIGRDKKNNITAEELAYLSGTINYEVVTRINPLIPRVMK